MTERNTLEGIDVTNVTEWFVAHVSGIQPPLSFELIQGGHSNLTFVVTDSVGRRAVLRRPPLGQVLATAHDMSREHTILAALGPTDVPVPAVLGLCDDVAVNGAPFYVMDFVEGAVVRDIPAAERLDVEQRRRASEDLIDTLADIHAVDVDLVGLGELGRRDGYIQRQLKRWHGQLEQSSNRDLPVLEEVYEHLVDAVPEQGPAAIVHGDYRLDNCMLGPDGSVVAVLDWELCTLGDPMADLGLLQVYWADEGDDATHTGMPAATTLEGFLTKSELLERYAARSGRDLSAIDFYVAFGYWKLACIIEGVYARYAGGAMGDRGGSGQFDIFGEQVLVLGDAARQAVGRIP